MLAFGLNFLYKKCWLLWPLGSTFYYIKPDISASISSEYDKIIYILSKSNRS